MLTSITPLGLRSRNASWIRTVVSFGIGAVVAALLTFGVAGIVGQLFETQTASPWVVIGLIALSALLDSFSVTPPGPKRQVNENWLKAYRDWAYGAGFGFQLGTGFATYVQVFAVWLLLGFAFLEPTSAVAIGVGFGLGRTALLITNRNVFSIGTLSNNIKRFTSSAQVANVALGLAYVVLAASVYFNGN